MRESVFYGRDIYSTVITDGGIGLFRLSSGQWEEVIPPQRQSISGLKRHGDMLYFSSDLDGVLNIYAYRPASGELLRLTNSEYGADYPYFSLSGDRLYYSEYSLGGYTPVSTAADTLRSDTASFEAPYRHTIAEMLSAQSEDLIAERGITNTLHLTAIIDERE